MEEKLLRQFEIIYKKLIVLENQVNKLKLIITNIDYNKNSLEKAKKLLAMMRLMNSTIT